jgi:hypothetical protein
MAACWKSTKLPVSRLIVNFTSYYRYNPLSAKMPSKKAYRSNIFSSLVGVITWCSLPLAWMALTGAELKTDSAD